MKTLLILFISFCFLSITFITEYKYTGQEAEIVSYRKQTQIAKADSVLALAMILKRECPECSLEEKVYLASCFITGAKVAKVNWKTYVFEYGQVWNLKDPRINYNPKTDKENLQASRLAWTSPKRVRFYTHKRDNPTHYNSVVKNKVYSAIHTYSFKYN